MRRDITSVAGRVQLEVPRKGPLGNVHHPSGPAQFRLAGGKPWTLQQLMSNLSEWRRRPCGTNGGEKSAVDELQLRYRQTFFGMTRFGKFASNLVSYRYSSHGHAVGLMFADSWKYSIEIFVESVRSEELALNNLAAASQNNVETYRQEKAADAGGLAASSEGSNRLFNGCSEPSLPKPSGS